MTGQKRQIYRSSWLLALAISQGVLSASADELVPAELADGVARYALDTGHLAPVISLAPTLTGDSADYLRARVLLGSGQTQEAKVLFEEVFASNAHRAESALELARLEAAEGDSSAAVRWYQEANRVGFGEIRQQAVFGLAETARSQGQADSAGQYLASMDDGYWAAVGYMNLAADFAKQDLNPSRALVALRVAMAMAVKDQDRGRSRDLLDQLYLRAGFLSVRTEEYDKATDFLEKVSLESYATPQALYLHGVALSERGNYRAAMQSWHRAKKFPLAFPGVSDAWLGMGRGYDVAGYPGQAGESWLAANAAYEGERVTLGKLAQRIRQDGAYKALVEDARGADAQWFLADSRTLTQPRLAYLLRFLEQPGAQAAVHRVAKLDDLYLTLAGRKHDLDVFIRAMEGHLGEVGSRSGNSARAALVSKHERLSATLAQLREQAAGSGQAGKLGYLERQLRSSAQRFASLDGRAAGHSKAINTQLIQARQLQAATGRLQEQIRQVRVSASAMLDEKALAFVAAEQQRMVHALDKTEQQIAHLYEYLALENIGEGLR
ncbi:MAG: hypothetical protein HLUCCX14_03775 [Marinobacter excellens HL-55]|uniref:Tetratricopeptide repeat n=1 Tax=Marinobacter excellens HL-55 TaxID=1305731 RepID=A0A0N8KL83_9GAMM|nr:MAG: hypothetical protein HLUCCX14_03775 [Marinobacter excellens HL-55]